MMGIQMREMGVGMTARWKMAGIAKESLQYVRFVGMDR